MNITIEKREVVERPRKLKDDWEHKIHSDGSITLRRKDSLKYLKEEREEAYNRAMRGI